MGPRSGGGAGSSPPRADSQGPTRGSPFLHLCYSGLSGATTVALNIARGSDRPGRHGFVFYGREAPVPGHIETVERLGCPWRYARKDPGAWPGTYRPAAKAIASLRPGAAVLHGSRTLPVALWLRVLAGGAPLVGVQHGPAREIAECPRRLVSAAFAGVTDRTVFVSDELAALADRFRLLRTAVRRGVVIPNGVDAEFWARRKSEPAEPPVLGAVAALEPYKDHPTLLQAVARLRAAGREVRAELVGVGSMDAALRRLAERLGVNGRVEFAGRLTPEELRERMGRWRVFVHPTRSEAMSMALLEAMSAAMPIAASDAPGVRGLLANERTALLTPVGDADALAGAIGRLLDDAQLGHSLAAAAQRQARREHALETMSAAYERLAEALTSWRAQ